MDNENIDVNFLDKVDIFKRFSTNQLDEIKRYFTIENFKDKDAIVKEGETGQSLYILKDGLADVYKKKYDEDFFIFKFKDKDIFGELALIEDVPRTASVIANGDVICYKLSREGYFKLSSQYPQLAVFLLEEVSRRMRETSDSLTDEMHKKNKELSKLYEELKGAHENLRELDKAKTNFITLISHELFTPINVFSSSLSLIQMKNDNPELKVYLDMISNKIKRMTNQIRQMIGLVQDEQFDIENIKFDKVNIKDLLNEFRNDFVPLFIQRNIEFVFNYNEDEVKEVEILPFRLRQILDEITYNAIRFTDDNGTVSISITYNEKNNALIIDCEDNGIGINEKYFSKIFKPFFEILPIEEHSSGQIAFKSGGLGLGLSIVHNNVKLHKGRIWLKSREDEGSFFRIALPINSDEKNIKIFDKMTFKEMTEIEIF